ncbi:MAG: hypothetical protein ABI307_01915 [Mycobacterium sp.]
MAGAALVVAVGLSVVVGATVVVVVVGATVVVVVVVVVCGLSDVVVAGAADSVVAGASVGSAVDEVTDDAVALDGADVEDVVTGEVCPGSLFISRIMPHTSTVIRIAVSTPQPISAAGRRYQGVDGGAGGAGGGPTCSGYARG